MNNYIMFHCHTDYSLLDSCSKPQEYIDLAVKNNMKAISFSEHGKPLNWTEKWGMCKKAGIKYIHSVEIYLTESLNEKIRDNYHTILIAKNMDGVREINKLVNISSDKEHFYYVNRITFDEFLNISDNVIRISACLASPLNKLERSHPRYDELVRKYNFLEIQPHLCEEQKEYNKRLFELSKEFRIPLIAGTDTHSSSEYKAECRKVLLSSKHKSYGDEDKFDLTFKTYDELYNMFLEQDALPEEMYFVAIYNTNFLDILTEELELDVSIKYPILYGSREKDEEMFKETVERKFKEKIENGVIPKEQEESFRKAIDEEMAVFKKLNMYGFMLAQSEIICWCKDNDMPIGTARGSVGGSRVAYITDIIDLNPETWHTVFSRFANEDRVEIGDIDIDCTEADRPKIFEYITERFGRDKTARVASFGTIQSKGVIDDVGRHLAKVWNEENPDNEDNNPYRLSEIAKIKKEFDENEELTKKRYKEIFKYYDGLIGTKISQSVHPAGIVISPITLNDNFGVFDKDNENCLLLDMENIHDYTGLAKYDFLILKTVQVINDTVKYLGVKYPKTNEIDWFDEKVWNSMIKSPMAIFQMESRFSFECLKKFAPKSIFDMSLVTASIRPSGTSYRDKLLKRIHNKNPSELIDELLKDNLGYLIYQEDTIKFLQEICGLSGSESDNIRRAIGRKQKDRLEKALPSILEGYCNKSNKPREIAENEAKEFLQIIEDSSNYQFGYNHSIAYCLLGYLCAYYRYYHPLEFITAFLNNGANEDDIRNGTMYAHKIGIKVTMPRFGVSRSKYFFDKEKNIIAKGLSSVKFLSDSVADELYNLSKSRNFDSFTEVLYGLQETSVNTRQLDILIKIDFFEEFGNQKELIRMTEIFYDTFKKGTAKQIKKEKVDGTILQDSVTKYSVGITKTGSFSKSYALLDVKSILLEVEKAIKDLNIEDFNSTAKARNFYEVLGYTGYVTGEEKDRRKLQISEIHPLRRNKDSRMYGYGLTAKSIGSGIETNYTITTGLYGKIPIEKGDIIYCNSYSKDGKYYKITNYCKMG